MEKEATRTINLIWAGVALAAADWLFETMLHTYMFGSGTWGDNFLPMDSNELWMRVSTAMLIIGAGFGAEHLMKKNREGKVHLKKLNRLLLFLSHINQNVQRLKTSQQIFERTCKAAVDLGGFRFAYVGLYAEEGIKPVAMAAYSEECLRDIRKADSDHHAVTCQLARDAAEDGKTAYCNLLADGTCQSAWREPLMQHGCQSAAAFPILQSGRAIGTFCVYAVGGSFFSDQEISILEEAADDVSHTLTRIETEALHLRDEEKLRQRVDELERFQEATSRREIRIKELRDENATLRQQITQLKDGQNG